MHPNNLHDSHVPLATEAVPEGVAVDSYPSSRRTSVLPANASNYSAPVTPLLEPATAGQPNNNRYSTFPATSDSRPSSSKYAPSNPTSEPNSAYVPFAPIEPSTGYIPATTSQASNPLDEVQAYEAPAGAREPDSQTDEAPVAASDYNFPSYGYQPHEPETPLAAVADKETGLMIDTIMENEYEAQASGYTGANYQPSSGYNPDMSTYDPGARGGYMPYQPDLDTANTLQPAEEDAESISRPKKKGIMDLDDEDDDFIQKQAEDLKRQQKAERDREADELVKKAAEADGKFCSYTICNHYLTALPLRPTSSPTC